MATWGYVVPLRAEHVEHLSAAGVQVPAVSPDNRAPDEAEVAAAYAECGAIDKSDLTVDCFRESGDTELTVALRGRAEHTLAFLLALAKRCGQLYLFPFPHDSVPGVVVDPTDDRAGMLGRMDPETRDTVETALRDRH